MPPFGDSLFGPARSGGGGRRGEPQARSVLGSVGSHFKSWENKARGKRDPRRQKREAPVTGVATQDGALQHVVAWTNWPVGAHFQPNPKPKSFRLAVVVAVFRYSFRALTTSLAVRNQGVWGRGWHRGRLLSLP